jgi:hypothetical protein
MPQDCTDYSFSNLRGARFENWCREWRDFEYSLPA